MTPLGKSVATELRSAAVPIEIASIAEVGVRPQGVSLVVERARTEAIVAPTN